MRILLISPPLCQPSVPNLAVEYLAAQARAECHDVDTLHGPLRQPRYFQRDLIHGLGAQACFTPDYFDLDPVQFSRQVAQALWADFERDVRDTMSIDELDERYYFGTVAAEQCLGRILADIPTDQFDLIGFSIGFDAQKLPAAAIARRLRGRGERAVFVAGGTGTDEEMGAALLERFPEFDHVLQGEADDSWPLLLRAIECGDGVGQVPGCLYRVGDKTQRVAETKPTASFLAAPVPNYDSYLAQLARSEYAADRTCLLVETSRGCWWGKKHHCTFCGIRSVDEDYRRRSGPQSVEVFAELYDRYQPDLIYCTDAIVAADAARSIWPAMHRARRAGRDWSVFYETKSNMGRRDIARMASAGVTWVQPGIESLVTPSLKAMNKGTTAIQQISFLKWALAYGVATNYGIITGMPGETAEQLQSLAALTRRLRHLPPPADLNRLALHRFSPHYRFPERFGITGVRVFAIQRLIYQTDDETVRRLVYQLDFDVPEHDERYETAREELGEAMAAWRQEHQAGAGLWIRAEGDLRVVARISGGEDFAIDLVADPTQVLLLDACTERCGLPRLARTRGLELNQVERAAADLEKHGLLFVEDDQALTLAVPVEANAERDAQWELEIKPEPRTAPKMRSSR